MPPRRAVAGTPAPPVMEEDASMTAFIWGVAAAVRQLNQDAVSRVLVAEKGPDERQVIPDETSVKRGGDRPHGEGGSRKRQKSHQTACARCGKSEHLGRNCKNCYFCGQPGHVRAWCPQVGQKKKKNVKTAPQQGQRKGQGFQQRRTGVCDRCGKPGHMGRDCKNCYKCGQPGHSQWKCPLAGQQGGNQ